MKRVFIIVIDSFGIGEMPDAKFYGDEGSNTLRAVASSKYFNAPNMTDLGLFNIDGCYESGKPCLNPTGCYARLAEKSRGKDTTTGHWEIAGLVSKEAMPTFPNGFPDDIIKEFEEKTGRKVLCNKPYSGTQVIKDYGEEHMRTGDLIVYTSADSVFQIAAHEDIVPIKELYTYCEIARKMLKGKNAVGRVIARPFLGKDSTDFYRTTNRHDFSLVPPEDTMLDLLKANGYDTIGVGKINDIFAGKGISDFVRTKGNDDGLKKTDDYFAKQFNGLCFVNLVDTDMIYGHRNDIDGYAKAVSTVDSWLGKFVRSLKNDDIVMVTADHGCDPSTPSTDHSREYIFMLAYGRKLKKNVNLGTRGSFADISATVLDYFGIDNTIAGNSFLEDITDD